MESARVLIEVVAGIIPEKPDPAYTERWAVSTSEWEERGMQILEERNTFALEYAMKLMLRPDKLNWVRVDWLWL